MTPKFKPVWWLPNGHLQTILAPAFPMHHKSLIKPRETCAIDRDICITWFNKVHDNNSDKPIVVLLHGILASIDVFYIKNICHDLIKHDYPVVFIHYRSDTGLRPFFIDNIECNDLEDLTITIDSIIQNYPKNPIYVIGYSWGGNILLRYLSDERNQRRIAKSIAVSVPFDLRQTATNLLRRPKQIYHYFMVKQLKANLKNALKDCVGRQALKTRLAKITNIQDYERDVLAPMYGYADINCYYDDTLVNKSLFKIQDDVLIIHSLDDPIVPASTIPKPNELSSTITLELHKTAGHIGFISGKHHLLPTNWLESRILTYLQS